MRGAADAAAVRGAAYEQSHRKKEVKRMDAGGSQHTDPGRSSAMTYATAAEFFSRRLYRR